jgi:hypothetical protein
MILTVAVSPSGGRQKARRLLFAPDSWLSFLRIASKSIAIINLLMY